MQSHQKKACVTHYRSLLSEFWSILATLSNAKWHRDPYKPVNDSWSWKRMFVPIPTLEIIITEPPLFWSHDCVSRELSELFTLPNNCMNKPFVFCYEFSYNTALFSWLPLGLKFHQSVFVEDTLVWELRCSHTRHIRNMAAWKMNHFSHSHHALLPYCT